MDQLQRFGRVDAARHGDAELRHRRRQRRHRSPGVGRGLYSSTVPTGLAVSAVLA